MGHTEIGVTMNVYGHLFAGKQRELTENLDGLLDQTPSRANRDRRGAEPNGRHAATEGGDDDE
jgi:hypothetical protein